MPFCYQCGSEVAAEALFCSGCGANLKKMTSKEQKPAEPETSKLLLSVKPVFIPWVTIVSMLPLQIFFTIW